MKNEKLIRDKETLANATVNKTVASGRVHARKKITGVFVLLLGLLMAVSATFVTLLYNNGNKTEFGSASAEENTQNGTASSLATEAEISADYATRWSAAIMKSVADGTTETFVLDQGDWVAQSYSGLASGVKSFTAPMPTMAEQYFCDRGFVYHSSSTYGAIYLPENAKIILDLNGNSINRNMEAGVVWGSVIFVGWNAELTVRDSKAPAGGTAPLFDADGKRLVDNNGKTILNGTGKIMGGWSTNGYAGGITVLQNGTLNFESGAVQSNKSQSNMSTHAGGILLNGWQEDRATLNMTGGVIADNVDSVNGNLAGGGGIYGEYENVNITGGYVVGNSILGSINGYSAGGIGLARAYTANIENVLVAENTGVVGGLNVYDEYNILKPGEVVTVKNVTIKNNTNDACPHAGGLNLWGDSSQTAPFLVENCTITGNEISLKSGYASATYYSECAGAYFTWGTFTIKNCLITDNKTAYGVAGMQFLQAKGTVDNVIISQNQSTSSYNGAYQYYPSAGLTMYETEVTATNMHVGEVSATDNTLNGVAYTGNKVFGDSSGKSTVAGVSIMNNSTFNLENGSISGNCGDGAYVYGAILCYHSIGAPNTVNLKNVDIKNNTLTHVDSYSILLFNGAANQVTFENVAIENNISASKLNVDVGFMVVAQNTSLIWHGGSFSNNSSVAPAFFLINIGYKTLTSGGSAEFYDVDITNNTSSSGTIYVSAISQLIMERCNLSDNTNSGLFCSALNIDGASASQHGVARLTDTKIERNKGVGFGGIFTYYYTEFSMVGGTVSDNESSTTSAATTAGICVSDHATASFENVVVKGNKTKENNSFLNVGGIFASDYVSLSLNRVTIGAAHDANAATEANVGDYGGLYMNSTATLSIRDTIIIKNNVGRIVGADGCDNFYYGSSTDKIKVEGPLTNSYFKIATPYIGVFTDGFGANNSGGLLPTDIFVSDRDFGDADHTPCYDISNKGSGATLEGVIRGNDNASRWTYAVQTSLENGGSQETFKLIGDWNAVNGAFNGKVADTPQNGYHYGSPYVPYIDYDGDGVNESANIILDLNGYKIDRGGANYAHVYGTVIVVNGGLTIIDSSMEYEYDGKGNIVHDEDGNPVYRAPYIDESGNVVPNGTGTITGGYSTDTYWGGAIAVGSNYELCTLDIRGGNFVNNAAVGKYAGTAISIFASSNVSIKNATFSNNTGNYSYDNGVIAAYPVNQTLGGETLEIDRCVFTDNNSSSVILAFETDFSITNTEMVGNNSYNIQFTTSAEDEAMYMENVHIDGGYSGIYIYCGEAVLKNVIIENQNNVWDGATIGLYAANASGFAGDNATVHASGLQILDGIGNYNTSAGISYAALTVSHNASLTLDTYVNPETGEEIRSKISGNSNPGGTVAVFVGNGATCNMTDVEMSNNTGGNVFYMPESAICNWTNVDIFNNTSTAGYLIYAHSYSELTFKNVNIRDNDVAYDALLWIHLGGTLDMTLGCISDNRIHGTNEGYGLLSVGYSYPTHTNTHVELHGVTISGNGGGQNTVHVAAFSNSLVMDDYVNPDTNEVTHTSVVDNEPGFYNIYVENGSASVYSSLSMTNVIIEGNKASVDTVYVGNYAHFYMSGGSISNNTAGVIAGLQVAYYINHDVPSPGGSGYLEEVVLTGVKIHGNKVSNVTNNGYENAGGVYANTPLTLENCEITENSGGYYAGVCVVEGNRLSVSNTLISNNVGVKSGAIYATGGTYLHNATISDNTATGSLRPGDKGAAGGVFFDPVSGGSMVADPDTVISGNKSTHPDSAGGVYTKGYFLIDGSTIMGNVAEGSASAGGVYIFGSADAKFEICAAIQATITLNTARAADPANGIMMGAGGVYVAGSEPTAGTLILRDMVIIDNNTLTDASGANVGKSNVYILDAENNMIEVGNLRAGASVGIYRRPIGVFTTGFGANNSTLLAESIFHSDNILSEVVSYDTDAEEIVTTPGFHVEGYTRSYDNEINWAYLVKKSLATGTQQTFVLYGDWNAKELISSTTSFGSDPQAYINGALYVPVGANMVIELNGSKLNRNLTANSGASRDSGYVIYVAGELTVQDNHRTDLSLIRPGINELQPGVTVYDGEITGGSNSTTLRAGGVYVAQNSQFTLLDGKITGNRGMGGTIIAGGVYVEGTFDMFGGAITDNEGGSAGGVYVANGGAFTLSGGEITNNRSTSSTNAAGIGGVRVAVGGNFYFGDGTKANLDKITITDNTLSTGVNSNVKTDDENYQIEVNGKFADGTSVGITRGTTTMFTSGYGQHHLNFDGTAINPTTYFFSDDEDHFVTKQGTGANTEAIMLGFNNRDNWTYAVETSLDNSGVTQTFTMFSDWTAEKPTTTNYTTEFGSNSNAYYHGALYVPFGASIILDLKGHTLNRNLSQSEIRTDGFVIYVLGELIIRDNPEADDATAGVGTITGGASRNNAGAIQIGAGGKVYFEGGEIKENIANFSAGSAGAVYVYGSEDTHFTMTGGVIKDNRGYDAGAVYVDNGLGGDKNGTFTMTGGSITNNTAVSANTGGVRINTTGVIELGGDAVIKDNSNGQVTNNSNLYLMYANNSGSLATVPPNIQVVSGFTNNAEIHITRESIGQFTDNFELSGTTRAPQDVFISDNSDYFVDQIEVEITDEEGNTSTTHEAFMKSYLANVNWSYTVQMSLTTGTTQTYSLDYGSWTATTNASNGTSFGNGVGYEQGRLWVPVGASIILDLKGNTIDRALAGLNAVNNGEVFFIQGELKIIDSSAAQTGKITGGNSTGTGGIYNSGKLTIEGGTITGNTSTAIVNGGGIYNSGTLTMTGGKVTGNSGYRAGIYVDTTGVVNLGGTANITGNFYDTTDEFKNPIQKPSNLYFKNTSAIINVVKPFTGDAQISVVREGLGVLTNGYGVFNTVNPETYFISESENNLYVISHINSGTHLEAAMISYDNATNWTHAVKTSLANNGAVQDYTLYSDWTPDDNHSFGNDVGYLYGGLHVPVGASIRLNLNGYNINRELYEAGTAVSNGFVFDIAGALTFEGIGRIEGGYSTNTAGGIHIEGNGQVDMQSGYIGGNYTTSNTDGGAITVGGKFTMTGGIMNDNGGPTCGGIYVTTDGTFELGGNGTKIEHNFKGGMMAAEFANIYLENPTGKITIVSPLDSYAYYTLSRDSIGPFTVGYSAFANGATFESEDPTYIVEPTSNGMELQFITHDNARNWEYAVQTSLDNGGATQEFTLWEDWNAENGVFGTENPYYINGALYVPVGASILFNQNGYALNRGLESVRANGYVMYVAGDLTLDDRSSQQTGVFTGGNNSSSNSAGGVFVDRDATFTMEGGKISGNNVYGAGGGGVYNNGTFVMNGGKIGAFEKDEVSYVGNRGLAGGVFNGAYGTFVMNGGGIEGNESTNNAGGVYIYNGADSSFTMNGGEIINNTAENAGGIYAAGKFTMTGGEISGNTATTNDVIAGGGSGVYVSATGVFTMTGGVIHDNNGLNGVRVYSSGVLNLGGKAQIYNNKNTAIYDATDPHEYRNVYLTISTQRVNIVSEFEEGAYIGVTRDASGIFTANYGTYNPTASPANFFTSDVTKYAVSSANCDVTNTIEAVIGTPVPKPTKLESPTYDGNSHDIISGYDSKYMSYGELPAGVTYDKNNNVFTAINAGEYTLTFEVKDGFCWPDGKSGTITVIAKIYPRIAVLEWQHLTDLVYNTREQVPTATVVNLVPGDVCDVIVTGGQIHAGSYTATASFLSNPNYTLENAEQTNIEKGFTISKAPISVEILNETAAYKTPEDLKLQANVSSDGITFITIPNSSVTYSVNPADASLIDPSDLANGILTALSSTGTVRITAYVAETSDTLAATSPEKEIVLEKATPKLGLEETSVEYGTDLELVVIGNDEATATVTLQNDTGAAVLNGTTLTPSKAGKVKITISTPETTNYFAHQVTVTVTIDPKVLTIEWDGPFEFDYDGYVHGPKAHATNLVDSDECDIIVSGQQKNAGEYLDENGAYAALTSNPNYTLEGAENRYHDFEIHKVSLPVDDKISLVDNTVDYGDTLKLAITGNKEKAEVTYEIAQPEVINPSWQYGDAIIYYGVDADGNKLSVEDRLDPFTATFEPTGDIGYVLVKVTIGESENYTGCVYYEYVLIQKAALEPTFYTDASTESREVMYGDDNCILEVVGNAENGVVDFTVLGGTGKVHIVGNVLKALQVGEVNIMMHIAATEHYDEIYVSEKVTIIPRPVILTWSVGTYIYDGTEQKPTAIISNAVFGDLLTVVVEGAIDAGNHTAKAVGITGPQSANYTLDEEEGALLITTPFTIQKRKIEAITWGNPELLFNGEYQAPSYSFIGLVSGDTCELVIENMGLHVGTYTATATGVTNDNYYIDNTTINRSVTYRIIKAPITLTINNEVAYYYNDTIIDLIGNIGNGAVTYTITTSPAGIATVTPDGIIFATDYGYITITVNVAATSDTYSGTVTKTIPVVKGEASLDLVETEVIYGDTLNIELKSKWHPDQVYFTLVNGTDEEHTGLADFDSLNRILTATGAGEVTIIIYTQETEKYLETKKEITITIHKRILTVDWNDTFTYDGTAKLPIAENIGNLAFDDDAPELTLDGAQTDVGSYTATVTGISNKNYALFVDEGSSINGYDVPFVIEKADMEITVAPEQIYINETDVPIILSGNESGNKPEYQLVNNTGTAVLNTDGNGNFTITPSAVGEVVLIVKIPASDNYNAFDGKFTIEILRLEGDISLETTEFYYGDTLNLNVIGEGSEDRTVTYTMVDGTGSAQFVTPDSILGTGAGTVIVTVTLAATDTFAEKTFDVTVSVLPRPVVLEWTIGTYEYDGTEQKPSATVTNLVGSDVVNVTVSGHINAGVGLIATATEVDNPNYTVVNGTNITVAYNIDRKLVTVDWDATTSFVYDGELHAPTATVTAGNLIGTDTCDVIVSGAQTDAYDAWVATVAGLSNSNYRVDPTAANSSITFEILTATPTVELEPVTIRYHEVSEVLSVICTPTGGDVTYTIISGDGTIAELVDGNKIRGLELGTFTLQIHVDSTMGIAGVLNTNEVTITVELTVEKGWQPFELAEDTVVYGSTLTLDLTGFDETASYTFVQIINIAGDDGDATLSGNVLTPVHVGTVKVKVVYDETAHYEQTTRELLVTITPYVLEFVWDNDPADDKLVFIYDGTEQAPVALPAVDLFGDDECEILVHGATNAGSHTATAYGTSNPNYTIVGSKSMTNHPTQDFVIKQRVVVIEWNETTLEFNGEPQTPTATIVNQVGGDDVSFTYSGHQTDLGFYTDDERAKITGLTGADSANYTLDGVDDTLLETDFEIVKGHPNLVLSVSSTSITYLQTVDVYLAGNVGEGEVTYEVVYGSGTFNFGEDGSVTFTPGGAGTVQIRAHVAETDRTYEADSNIVTISVAKAHWSIGLSYDSSYFATGTSLHWAPGVVPYSYQIMNEPYNDRGGSWMNYNTFVGNGVGTYRIWINWNGNANFVGGDAYVYVYVGRRPLTIDWDTLEFTYNGQVQAPEVTTHTQALGDKFSVRFEGAGVDAGSYVASAVGLNGGIYRYGKYYSADTYYVLTGDNLSSSYSIGRAEINPVITTTDAEYHIPLQLLLDGNLGNGAVRYELLEGGTGSATIDGDILNPTGLGTVVVKAYIEQTKNYHAAECTAIITIGKRIPQLVLDSDTVIYGDTLQLVVNGNEENGQIMFSVEDGTGSATITPNSGILTPVSVGTVKVTISVTETENFRAFTVEREVTILPRPITIEWDEDTLEFEYDGTLKTPVAHVVTGVVNGDTVEIDVIGSQINAGVYTATASSANPNYVIDPDSLNITTEFMITPKVVEISIDQDEAYLGVALPLTVTSNVPINSSQLVFTVSAAGGDATLQGNVITGTQSGKVVVSVMLPATGNYQGATDMKIFEIKKYVPNIGLETNEVVYGSSISLEETGNLGEGAVSFALAHALGDTGSALLTGNTLKGTKVGTVTIRITVAPTMNYDGGDFDVVVTVLPRPVILVWGGDDSVFEFEYNGEEQYPEVRVLNVLSGDVCNVTQVQGATDAGSHFAAALELDNENYTLVNGQNVEDIPFTITQKVVELDWEDEEFVYNNEMQAPNATINNLLPADIGKSIQVIVTGETHATKTWLGEVATATATLVSDSNYTLIGCPNLTYNYVIEQLEAELEWDDPCEVIYNGPNTELPGAVVSNKYADDECDVLVREFAGTAAAAHGISTFAGSASATSVMHIAEAYGFEGANEDDYKLPADRTNPYTEIAQEITINWGDLELVYTGEAQYPTYTLQGLMAGDDVSLQFNCSEEPVNVKYASNNVTIVSYTATVTLTGADASHYAISVLQQSPDSGTGEMRATVDFKIVPRPVTVYATSKDVQLLLELDTEGHMILDKFQTMTWTDWFSLTCNQLVGQDVGANIEDIFDVDNLFLSPAFYRITRNGDGDIISISDERVIPGLEGPDIGLGEYKIGIIIENLTSLGCLTGNYVAEVQLNEEEYGILTIIRDDAVLKLTDTSGYQFLYLEKTEDEEFYRRAYAELGWKHGEDDANSERVVLGQILPETLVNDFLANIDASQINNIKITAADGTVLYDCGSLLDEFAYVGTGAKVELMLGGEAIDTLYLSILGDVNGDGEVTTVDASDMNTFVASSQFPNFDLDEYLLAALIANNGSVSALDAANVNAVIAGNLLIDMFFYQIT